MSSSPQPQCCLEHLTGEHQGISVLTLHRPQVKNALGRKLVAELKTHVATLASTPVNETCRVLILKSDTPNVFCAGADLKERAQMTLDQVASFVQGLQQTFTTIERLAFPVIAAMEGVALGGGLELALATDLRIASEGTRMGLPETKLAIIPAAGGTQRLPRIIGMARAKELIFTGRWVDAHEALQIGLIHEMAPTGQAYHRALIMATTLTKRGPLALRMAKLALMAGSDVALHAGLAIEDVCYARLIPTADRVEGLEAFQRGRLPHYQGK